MTEHNDIDSIINKAQIFDNKSFHEFSERAENLVPNEVWAQYYIQFKWMFYENGLLQCRKCQEAFESYPSQIEIDEWTEPSEYSYKKFNKENLILILKMHDLSDNHICSINMLQSNSDNIKADKSDIYDRNGDGFLNESFNNISDSFYEETSLPIISSSCSSSRWSRYIQYYPWLYLKHNNPGCRYCEEAFKISSRITASKWTDPTPSTEINCIDRPNRALRRHNLSKSHRESVEVLNKISIDDANITCEDNYPKIFNKDKWESIQKKHTWIYYKFGSYHCMFCEKAYETQVILFIIESKTNKYSENGKLRQFNKHQNSKSHKVAEEKLHSKQIISLESYEDDLENSSIEDNSRDMIHEMNYDLWKKLLDKYSWFIGENGKYYGCRTCHNAFKPNHVNNCTTNLWANGMIPFGSRTNYEHLRKKLYAHNMNRNHIIRIHLENTNENNNILCKTELINEASFNHFILDQINESKDKDLYDQI